MILTCPECATSYFVDDARIPPAGRTVKCSSCDARWRAMPGEGALVAPAEPADPPDVEPVEAEAVESPEAEAAEPAETAAEPEAEADRPAAAAAPAAVEDDLEVSGPEPMPKPRPAPPPKPERRSPAGVVVAWSLMAATVAAVVGGAIFFREDVVRLWPVSSGAYAGLGLPVNEVGLVIEHVRVDTPFQGGRPVLSVTGQVRNVAGHAAEAPPLRIDLLDKSGRPVAAKVARPIDARIPAGAKRYFAIAIPDPPSTAHDVQVAFAPDATPAAPEGHATEAAEVHGVSPGPAPVEAKPLPADSPDALHDHG